MPGSTSKKFKSFTKTSLLKVDIVNTQELTKPNNMAAATEIAAKVPVNSVVGGFTPSFKSMDEVIQFAQLMAGGGPMIGSAFRNKPGACLGIIMQASRLSMDPFALSQKSYLVKDTIGYEAQAVISMLYASGIIEGRIRFRFEGEGQERVCIATAKVKGDPEPIAHRSPPYRQIQPKNSPLWKSDPDQQQSYYTARAWGRLNAPDVLMGVYTREEAEAMQQPTVTPSIGLDDLTQRLTESSAPSETDQPPLESPALATTTTEPEDDAIEITEDLAREKLSSATTDAELNEVADLLIENGGNEGMINHLAGEYAEALSSE